jgi:sugar phosphate isomerase/epimerase
MQTVTRRSFITALGAGFAAAPAILRARARAARFPITESHGDFTHSADINDVLTQVDHPNVALLWDAHHSFATAKEQPADTFAAIGKWTRHTHLKDSVPQGTERKYVLLGTGEVPVQEQVHILAKAGYQGFYCFEWEKKWHPEIEAPEVAFPHCAKTMADYLTAAGIKAR